MTFSIDDIDIYIATYNRADYLRESIYSILNQTVDVNKITVLDNESTDNTKDVVMSLQDKGVRYIKTTGNLGNFLQAQKLSSKPYTMLFHDDDLLNPGYLESALKCINTYQDISIVTGNSLSFFNNDIPKIEKMSSEHLLLPKPEDFSKLVFYFNRVAYAAAIYKTEYFKKMNLEYEKFSKLNDKPFMVKVQGDGAAVYFTDSNCLYVRTHKQQDTVTSVNTPTLDQLSNWFLFFYNKCKVSDFKTNEEISSFRIRMNLLLKHYYNSFLSATDKEQVSLKQFKRIVLNTCKAKKLPYDKTILGYFFKRSHGIKLKRFMNKFKQDYCRDINLTDN